MRRIKLVSQRCRSRCEDLWPPVRERKRKKEMLKMMLTLNVTEMPLD